MMNTPGTPANVDPAKRRLGRGLSSLISSTVSAPETPQTESAAQAGSYEPIADSQPVAAQASEPVASAVPAAAPVQTPMPGEKSTEISIDAITPNPYQPRRSFDQAELADLTASIQAQGVLMPLIVAEGSEHSAGGAQFVLIAGERRLRAAKAAGLSAVPCIVRQVTQRQMLEWAIIENIHRADLNAVEKATAYRDYIDRFQLTQADAAERLGIARASLANFLRILDLPDSVQHLLLEGRLTFGHAKALAGLAGQAERQEALARKASDNQLSVRQLEQQIAAALAPQDPKPAIEPKAPYIRDLEDQLTSAVGTRVQIRPGRAKNSGKILIDFYGLEDFDRITSALGLKVTS